MANNFFLKDCALFFTNSDFLIPIYLQVLGHFPSATSPTQFPQSQLPQQQFPQPLISPTLTSPVTNFPNSNFPNSNFPMQWNYIRQKKEFLLLESDMMIDDVIRLLLFQNYLVLSLDIDCMLYSYLLGSTRTFLFILAL